jgi:nucleotide-binding universal stress UspA family protein
MYERILVPTDGSECADAAATEAVELAKQFGASLHAVYVVDAAALPSTIDAGYVSEALEDAGEEALERIGERANAAGVAAFESDVVYGTPHRAIVQYAEDAGVGLVVMGTHGRSGIERYLLGSVTEKVVRTADVPVLTVRPEADEE